MNRRNASRRLLVGLPAAAAFGCRRRRGARRDPGTVVFKNQPLWGEPAPFAALLQGFTRETGLEVRTEPIPNASDLAHQFFLTSLEAGADEYDVLVLDVVWAPEFARAGWIADLSAWFPPERLAAEFLPGPVEAVVRDGRTWAVPWYVDVGILYRRTDLAPEVPRTYEDLARAALAASADDPSRYGFVWQGRQYEGLSCVAFEAIHGHGGETFRDGRVVLETEAARAGLAWLRRTIAEGISPPSITAAAEEETRRLFQAGRAVFMRNWPYAWELGQQPDSPVRGRIGVSALPTLGGEPGAGTLGGWQLAVNANLPPARRDAAARLVAHLTSPAANLVLARHYARNPARRAVYEEPRLREAAPFIADLLPMVERARPRPVTPYYNLVSEVLQAEFSAAVNGIRTPAAALARAQVLVDRVIGDGREGQPA